MARISLLLFVLVACFATAMQAQAPAPKPDPEVKKLHVWVGHWTLDGEYKPGPLGPGGKLTIDWTGQMILGGFFLQGRSTEKGPMGETRGVGIYGYDPANKNYPIHVYIDDGTCWSTAFTVSGNTWTWTGQVFAGGKQYQVRGTYTLAADLMSTPDKVEISVDGKTWTPFREGKWTKAKPVAKK